MSLFMAVAIVGPLAPATTANAASLTVTTDTGHHQRDRRDWKRYRHDNGRHVGDYRGKHRGWREKRRHVESRCVVKTVRYWRHGHRVVKRTRVCG